MKKDKDEKELLDSVERGEWTTVPDSEKESQRYQRTRESTSGFQRRISCSFKEGR